MRSQFSKAILHQRSMLWGCSISYNRASNKTWSSGPYIYSTTIESLSSTTPLRRDFIAKPDFLIRIGCGMNPAARNLGIRSMGNFFTTTLSIGHQEGGWNYASGRHTNRNWSSKWPGSSFSEGGI